MLDRLESAFRKIAQFTADASHELRTPMALIRTTAELALRKTRPSAEYEHALQQILTESERTTELIDKLLTLARADAGQAGAKLAPLDLKSALAETVEAGQKLAEASGLKLEIETPDLACPILGDLNMLRRLVMLLLDNAVKYTPPPGTIRVSLERHGSFAILAVRDTGMGIAAEDLPHIFERFYRADKARGRVGGAGLGLAIAKWIVGQHRGEIRVESVPGQGSTFRVYVPLAGWA
jgi:signal transduction histidine kinase